MNQSVKRTVTLLGATGSIGRSTVDLLLAAPDRFEVEAVASGNDAKALADVAKDLKAKIAIVSNPNSSNDLQEYL